MKFYALLLALLCVMNMVEATQFDDTELQSAKCKKIEKRFVKGWKKLDTNQDGKLTWVEMYSFYVKWASKHGKSSAWIKKHAPKVYNHW